MISNIIQECILVIDFLQYINLFQLQNQKMSQKDKSIKQLSVKKDINKQFTVTFPNNYNTALITQDQLIKMKLRAKLITASTDENQDSFLLEKSRNRTNQWPDNVKDLKKRKEQERFKKFQKEQLERRRIDHEEFLHQQLVKEEAIKEANQKIFKNQEKIKALNSKLLYSDTLQQRQNQIGLKQHIKQIEKKREQFFNQQLIKNVKKLQEQERRKKQQEKEKNKKFELQIRKQHKAIKKQYIKKMKEDIIQGQLLKQKTEEAKLEEEAKQRQRRQREVELKKQANIIDQQNKLYKQKQLEKQKQQQAKIQEYKKKQQKVAQIRKKKEKQQMQQKIIFREQLLKKQLDRTINIKKNDEQTINKQAQQIRTRQDNIENKKREQIKRLKKEYEDSLKFQTQKKREQKQRVLQQKNNFNQIWTTQLNDLHNKEQDDKKFMKEHYLKHQQFLKQQAEIKRKNKEDEIRKEIQESEKIRTNKQNDDQNFKSYAEKCLKEWSLNGKNLYPMMKHLATYKQN